jgi:hypothetical protein
MIRYYGQVLLNGTIEKTIQPLLYMIAVHHLNGFLYDQTRTEQVNLQRTIMKNLQMVSTNGKVCLKIYFAKVNIVFSLDVI